MKRGMPRGPWDVGAQFPDAPRPRSRSRWFWGGFFAVLLVGLLVGVLAALRGAKQWAEQGLAETRAVPPVLKEVIRVTLSGETLTLDPAGVSPILAETRAWLEQRGDQLRGPIRETVERETERIYRTATEQVPAFADWYFSLSGEYSRLFQAVAGSLPTYLADQLDALVLGPAGTAQALDQLAERLEEQVSGQIRESVSGLRELLTQLVRQQALVGEAQVEVTGTWDLEGQLTDHLSPYLRPTASDLGRQGVATTAGAGLAAASAKKLGAAAVAKASTKLAAGESAALAAASKLGLKSAAKAGALGGTGVGAASGAALCAGTLIGVPLAPGCALVGGAVTGVATWLLVDKAVLEAEELLEREAFEEDLRGALRAQRDELREVLNAQYLKASDQAIARLIQGLDDQLRPVPVSPARTFIPAQAVEQAAASSTRARGQSHE